MIARAFDAGLLSLARLLKGWAEALAAVVERRLGRRGRQSQGRHGAGGGRR